MTVYVDRLMDFGWVLRGRPTKSCHMFSDDPTDHSELHAKAEEIGMRREWFQGPDKSSYPHYDLTPRRRVLAVEAGAVEVDRQRAAEIRSAGRERMRLAAASAATI